MNNVLCCVIICVTSDFVFIKWATLKDLFLWFSINLLLKVLLNNPFEKDIMLFVGVHE